MRSAPSLRLPVLLAGALWLAACGRDSAPEPAAAGGSPAAEGPEARSYAEDSVFRPEIDRTDLAGEGAGDGASPPAAPASSPGLIARQVVAPRDARPFSYFGQSIALFGDTLVVGAPYDDEEGTDAGAAYVFVRGGEGWRQKAKLVAPAAQLFDRFGMSVAVHGDMVVVGADRRDPGGLADAGAAYVFVRRGESWPLAAELRPADLEEKDGFGLSVATDGDTVLVGAPGKKGTVPGAGAAYVFVRRGQGFAHEARLAATDSSSYAGFGYAVAVDAGTALVGAFAQDGPSVGSGAAYVFRRRQEGVPGNPGRDWHLEGRLAAPSPGAMDKLGTTVALAGDFALVGAPRASLGDKSRVGAAFLFRRAGGRWSLAGTLTAPRPRSDEEFGKSVALSASNAVVGSNFGDAAGLNTGVAYLFARDGEAWVGRGPITAFDAAAVDKLGYAVAVSGERAALGAPRRGDDGNARGVAYLYDFPADRALPGTAAAGSSKGS